MCVSDNNTSKHDALAKHKIAEDNHFKATLSHALVSPRVMCVAVETCCIIVWWGWLQRTIALVCGKCGCWDPLHSYLMNVATETHCIVIWWVWLQRPAALLFGECGHRDPLTIWWMWLLRPAALYYLIRMVIGPLQYYLMSLAIDPLHLSHQFEGPAL